MEDPRNDFINTLDFSRISIREYPSISFVCGGPPSPFLDPSDEKKQYFPSVRSYITHCLGVLEPNVRYQNAEDIKEWNNYSVYDDLIEFERDIAHICKTIVLFVESSGSIAELGAFSIIPEITSKLLVFVHSNYSESTSYIALGPIRKINNIEKNKVHFITWSTKEVCIKDESTGLSESKEILEIDSMNEWGPYACGVISEVNNKKRARSTRGSSEYKRTKEALFVCDIVGLFKAVTEDEVFAYFIKIRHKIKKKDLKRLLFCLEKLNLIYSRTLGGDTFYVREEPSAHRYLKYDSGIDMLRLSAQLDEYYSHPAQLSRREVIKQNQRCQDG